MLVAGLVGVASAALGAGSPWRDSRGPGGVVLRLDERLKFPVPRPEDLPLVSSGEATLPQLISEGEQVWYFGAPLEGEPFGVPAGVFDVAFGAAPPGGRRPFFDVLQGFTRIGLSMQGDEALPRGFVRVASPEPLITQNCSACHSGVVEGQLIPGVGNKWYNQRAIIDGARALMTAAIPLLQARPDPEGRRLLAQTRNQLAKLERYDALYSAGCKDLAPGMITAARIWQISSRLLHDPAQLSTRKGQQKFECGATKPPPLNTLKFRNLLFWYGSVNSLWVAHWPMFDFFGFDNYARWEQKIQTREVQALDAFVVFGTQSPSWESVMKTQIHTREAQAGYQLFHTENGCASCHGTYGKDGMLKAFQPSITPLAVIGTDEERARAAFDGLMQEFAQYGWASVPRLNGLKEYAPGYAPMPLCSTFLNFPYLHTAGVANLDELLLPQEQRARGYWMADFTDKERVGYWTGAVPPPPPRTVPPMVPPPRVERRQFSEERVNGHSGARFGTTLNGTQRRQLIEYLKTLRCPEERAPSVAMQP